MGARPISRRSVSLAAASILAAAPTTRAAPLETQQLKDRLPQWRKLSSARAQTPPYASIGSIAVWHGEAFQRPFGTVWICGTGRVATAAHVLRDVDDYLNGGNVADIGKGFELKVRLGYTRGGTSVQDARIVRAEDLHPHPSHRFDMDPFDYGYINCNVHGRSLLTPSPVLDQQLDSVELSGYPSGTWSIFHDYPGDELVSDTSKAEREDAYFTYTADTFGGHSGAPVLKRSQNGDVHSVAVHVGPHCDRNKGVWINETVADFLRN